MAAKQGLTAQLSSAGEEAKRALLSRTNLWFTNGDPSNLNTVCTIKSAPPRSPEVLNLLATKSGWLYKRNEQHVWQARWCCVVPHMFLYYFDAHPTAGGNGESGPLLPAPSAQQQDEWNKAISRGYHGRGKHERRSHFPSSFFPSANESAPDVHGMVAEGIGGIDGLDDAQHPPTSTLQQPTGIIDLECYTAVHRSAVNGNVMQLAGDDTLNPDLRTFYFCANEEEATQDWIQALLHNRHAALLDECDAYKQVCDGFAQQLQKLHQELDECGVAKEEAQQELYRVRSQQEDVRRSCWRLSEEGLLSTLSMDEDDVMVPTIKTRSELRQRMEQLRAQDFGVTALVQVLTEYSQQLEQACLKEYRAKLELQNDLQNTGKTDQAKVLELESQLRALQEQYQSETASWRAQTTRLQAQLTDTQKELQDVQKALNTTQLEMTMNGSQQRNQMKELTQHKKILKNEVLDLRRQLDAAKKELSSTQHEKQQQELVAKQEEQKSKLLERYVEKMESQVKVQQNMMEMMSHSGMMSTNGSVYGGSVFGPGRNVVVVRNENAEEDEDDFDDLDAQGPNDVGPTGQPGRTIHEEPQPVEGRTRPVHPGRRIPRRGYVDDYDNKSHVSELTEDRTQRHFESMSREFGLMGDQRPSPRHFLRASPKNQLGPPSYIIGVKSVPDSPAVTEHDAEPEPDHEVESTQPPPKQAHPRLDTIDCAVTLPSTGTTPQAARRDARPPPSASPIRDSPSASSEKKFSVAIPPTLPDPQPTEKKLSVAQRARLEADRKSTPVRARLDEKTKAQVEKHAASSPVHRHIAPMHIPQSNLPSSYPTPAHPTPSHHPPTHQTPSHHTPTHHTSSNASASGGLWRRVEEVVLPLVVARSDIDSDDDASSFRSTRVTDYTDDERGRDLDDEEEKKTETSSLVSLSLQERSRLQRAKQLQFLRDQGLISADSDVKGGATDTASVASSGFTASGSAINFSSLRGPRRDTPPA